MRVRSAAAKLLFPVLAGGCALALASAFRPTFPAAFLPRAAGASTDLLDARFDPALREWMAGAAGASAAPPRAVFLKPRPGGPGAPAIPPGDWTGGARKSALLEFDGPSGDLASLGFTILGETDGAAAVSGPPDAFRKLGESTTLTYARLSRPLRTSLDSSLVAIRAPALRRGDPPHYEGPTGRGVVVGIVDTGVDLYHNDFRKADGSSRIVAFWDQYASGTSQEVAMGRVYRAQEIAFYLAWPDFEAFDLGGHGTHVAGIAAGDGSEAGHGRPFHYVGVAPEADLVAVRTYLDEASVVAGVQFVFDEAARRGEPAVVNLSLGHQYGPHDGTDPFERILSDLCGPGRLVVVASGNEGDLKLHARMEGGARVDSVGFFVPSYVTSPNIWSSFQIDGWTSSSANCEYTLVLPDGRRLGPVTPGSTKRFDGPGYSIDMSEIRLSYGREMWLEAQLTGPEHLAGPWTLVMRPRSATARPRADFWIPFGDLGVDKVPFFTRGLDFGATIGAPANAENVIAVSALVTKTCWTPLGATGPSCFTTPGAVGQLAGFSSLGPTRDGRMKPEVCAPGMGIVSSLSISMSQVARNAVDLPKRLDPDGVHWISAGTSMATPHVTGALALVLQHVPDLTPAGAQGRLLHSGIPVDSPEGTWAGRTLDVEALARPLAVPESFEARVLSERRARLEWKLADVTGNPVFHLSRSPGRPGPWERLASADATGRGPHEFVDGPLEPGRTFYYLLSAEDPYGVLENLDTLLVTTSGEPGLVLRPPRNNPGRPPIRLSFYIPPREAPVPWHLDVFDVGGRRVRRLGSGRLLGDARDIVLEWDGTSDLGRPAGSGIYLVRLAAGEDTRTAKLVLTR